MQCCKDSAKPCSCCSLTTYTNRLSLQRPTCTRIELMKMVGKLCDRVAPMAFCGPCTLLYSSSNSMDETAPATNWFCLCWLEFLCMCVCVCVVFVCVVCVCVCVCVLRVCCVCVCMCVSCVCFVCVCVCSCGLLQVYSKRVN